MNKSLVLAAVIAAAALAACGKKEAAPAPAPAPAAAPAAEAPAADAVVDVISTPADQVDVTVAADPVVHADVKADAGVDVVEAVKEAFEATPEVVAEPKVE